MDQFACRSFKYGNFMSIITLSYNDNWMRLDKNEVWDIKGYTKIRVIVNFLTKEILYIAKEQYYVYKCSINYI